jgi:VanZ family protein
MNKKIQAIFKQEGRKKYIPGIAWFFLTAVAISIPGYDLPKVGPWFEQISFDKLIHTFLFGTLAVLFMYPVAISTVTIKEKTNWFIKAAAATVVWGFTTEIIQKYIIPKRSYDTVDLLADALGAVIAYFFFKMRFGKTVKT